MGRRADPIHSDNPLRLECSSPAQYPQPRAATHPELYRSEGAHLTEYAILTTLCFTMGTWGFQKPWQSVLPFAVLGSAIFAVTDEFHQSFVPNRGASPVDVMIDITGALMAVGLISIWKTRFQPETEQDR